MPTSSNVAGPLVSTRTTSQAESVETILNRMRSGRIFVPDYQRDSDQWDAEKKSLFIESILNNLTVPAFFLAETDNGDYEVVDGQQRLTTIEAFHADQFALSSGADVPYLADRAWQYAGRNYSYLSSNSRNLCTTFSDYLLTIIMLPPGIDNATKLEIFRRINEGGTPLSAQDIRLAYFGDCPQVYFLRLAGIHRGDAAAKQPAQMISNASAHFGVTCPWDLSPIHT